MLPLQRRESGGERAGEKESDGKLWDELHLLEEAFTSGSIGNSQLLINKNTTKDVPTARAKESPPIKQDKLPSLVSQHEQQEPTPQGAVTNCEYPSQMLSSHTKPSGSLQNGRQETISQPEVAASDPFETNAPKALAHMHKKAEKKRQEGLGAVAGQSEHLIDPKQAPTRSDSLNDSAAHSRATRGLRPFRRRKPQPWPNPQQSLGDMIGKNNKNIKGKAWVAEGPALELFKEQILPQMEKLLDNTDPPHCAPLFLVLYMIGKDEMSASPIVMICCGDRKVRKDAEATIRESGILQQFPQIGLGNSATQLETASFVMPTTGTPTEGQMDAPSFSNFEEEHIIGRRLRLIDKIEGKEIVRYATGGPFVRIDKHIYQLTAFHYGQGGADTGPAGQLDSDPDECEYDGQSDADEDESDLEEFTEEEPSLKVISSTGLEKELASQSMAQKADVALEEHDRQDPWDPPTLPKRRNIDYDLVRLPDAEASKAKNTTEGSKKHHSIRVTEIGAPPTSRTAVIVVTTYDFLTGTILPGSKRVKMHGFYGFQDLLTARLSCPIKTGDSGSAVFDASTGCFYGHIILGSAPDTLVYIVPSVNIFSNLVTLFRSVPTLNLEGPIVDARIPQGFMPQKEHLKRAATNPPYHPQSNSDPQQRRWFDHDPAVTYPNEYTMQYPESQTGLIAGLPYYISANMMVVQSQVNRKITRTGGDNEVTWNYEKPVYDFDRDFWYWEGRRRDGSRVRQYHLAGQIREAGSA